MLAFAYNCDDVVRGAGFGDATDRLPVGPCITGLADLRDPAAELEHGIVRLTMNRPEARNALSLEMIRQLMTQFEAMAHDDTVRVVILAGAGPAFCAGHDLKELRGQPTVDFHAKVFGLAARLVNCDEYAELFDPYADTRPTAFRLSDDLAAVAADLIHGLQHYEAGRSLEALWWWQYSYVNHWGTHGGAALRALHAIVAHALLDVAEESTPG